MVLSSTGDKKPLSPLAIEIAKALVIALSVTMLSFIFGAFDDSRRATPDLRQQLALIAQQVAVMNENQKGFHTLLAQMHSFDSKAALLEQRLGRLEEDSKAAAARSEAQYREISLQISNVQQSLTRGGR